MHPGRSFWGQDDDMLLGAWEILLVLVVALIVLGPEKLPEVARKLARVVGQLRRIADDVRQNVEELWEDPPSRNHEGRFEQPKQLAEHEQDASSVSCDGRGHVPQPAQAPQPKEAPPAQHDAEAAHQPHQESP